MMRKLHRWISTAGMVVLFYLVVTGTVLAVEEFFDPSSFAVRFADAAAGPGNAQGMGGQPVAKLPAAQLEAMTVTVLNAALAALPDTPVQALRINLQRQGEQVRGLVTVAGAQTRTLAFDALTGAVLPLPAGMQAGMAGGMQAGEGGGQSLSLNALLQRIHSGAIVGSVGQWLILATGCALIMLSVTGIWMFFQLLAARSKRGKKAWFWR
ncbi:MAG: PepSY-associated TM helix domain-containing protein [Steroidobacteraceae bacterium]